METAKKQFAVIKSGGKQYKVEVDDVLKVEKVDQKSDAKDNVIDYDDILFGKKVIAKVIAEGKNPKIRIIKFKAKKRYKRVNGHRQLFSQIKIEKIV